MKITSKIWFFIIVVLLSCISLFVSTDPIGITFFQKGVSISSVNVNSTYYDIGLRQNMIINKINGNVVENVEDFQKLIAPYYLLNDSETIRTEIGIKGNNATIIGLFGNEFVSDVTVKKIPSSKIKTGLDLQGGARAFVKIKSDNIVASDLDDVISVLEERLNAYGLSDMKLYKVDGMNELLIGIEIAGSSPEQLESLIEEQGHFEAKIGNETVFVGGNNDITHVFRTGDKAQIERCGEIEGGENYCNFRFSITLSPDAAERFANITRNLSIVGEHLSENITFYIDDVNTSTFGISSSLKGNAQTEVSITGGRSGKTRQDAYYNSLEEMKKIQTILITGSLPYDLEIVKIDRISANIGEEFISKIILAGIVAFLFVSIFVFIKYRDLKICLALVVTSFSEIIITLGIASLINWNLDLPALAGIVAAIGTGIDSEIVILDETNEEGESLKQRIKKALFIITTSFATTLVGLIPLTGMLSFLGIGSASAGLLKGFAVTTIIGISVGVFVSRPAFSDVARQLKKE